MVKKENNINITIIGAGSWGTTLSVILAGKGYDINLWTRSGPIYKQIKNYGNNEKYTGSLCIPGNVTAFMDLEEGIGDYTDIVIFAVPSHVLREIISRFSNVLERSGSDIKCIVNVAKGFETGSNLRLSEVMGKCLPAALKEKICVLSGPNIAVEISRNLPSVSVIASYDSSLLKYIQPIISTDNFRIYTNTDVVGVEIGGAVKNIIAIAAGISDGLEYGANTKASLITRGLYELGKFGLKMGARPLTFSGAAGMGDLIATCISEHSRNRKVGERIAKGERTTDILDNMYMVAEGVKTTKAVYELADELKLDVPITKCIYEIIYKDLSPEESVKKLMNRKSKAEI